MKKKNFRFSFGKDSLIGIDLRLDTIEIFYREYNNLMSNYGFFLGNLTSILSTKYVENVSILMYY